LAPLARDHISVDLHGLKAALDARAWAVCVGVSVIVRRAVERELGVDDAVAEPGAVVPPAVPAASTTKLSIRLTPAAGGQLAAGARRCGLSRGAFASGLGVQRTKLRQA
jgi:hypothetical protein